MILIENKFYLDFKSATSIDEKGTTTYIQYSTTQRGRVMLIYNGYRYVENRQSHKNIFWRCSRYVKYGCRATVVTSKVTDEDITIRIAGSPHTHDQEIRNSGIDEWNDFSNVDSFFKYTGGDP